MSNLIMSKLTMSSLTKFLLTAFGLALLLTGASSPLAAQEKSIVEDIIRLRSEMEAKGQEIEAIQKQEQADLDFWIQKKMELQSSLEKEKLRELQLTEKILHFKRNVRLSAGAEASDTKRLQGQIADAKQWVESTIPYRKAERLERLTLIADRLKSGLETVESLTSELWDFYESELKISAENDYRINDGETVRLGLYAIFTRSPHGQYQRAIAPQTQLTEFNPDSFQRTELSRLFENFKNKKKSGFYSIPLEVEKL